MDFQQHQRQRSSPTAAALNQSQHSYSHPQLHTQIPASYSMPLRTTQNTPVSSPGLFSPNASRSNTFSLSESNSPLPELAAPYLHPLQTYKVRETHKALIDSDLTTGRKLINQYEVIEEIGRGMHGKVKLARNLETGENVAIKIIPRFSKKRRLGKVTAMAPQDKTKKEIAILKKIRHPNIVALLEVIDDPELKKIYMVLEHAELGEVVWRKKGLPHICQYERRRVERETRGEARTAEEEKYDQLLERRQALKEIKHARMAQRYTAEPSQYWSLEHGPQEESGSSVGNQSRIPSRDDFAIMDGPPSRPGSRNHSRGPSRSHSIASVAQMPPSELDEDVEWDDDMETPGPLRSNPNSATALDAVLADDAAFRGRSPSMADSIISHMSSIDFNPHTVHDSFADDYSYVPCFTMEKARSTFRDTVLGLEYLHYQGVVHRDIKPANLLWSKEHRVKISDFGVSYFGRPIRDGELDETVSESEAKDFDDDLELAKTVGTPAFFAPELCYTDVKKEQPKVSEQIDVWSLGVTLYCLIFGRIPFLAEDEFQMFRKIATDDVHIPRRRLKPVDPSTSPTGTSLYKRLNSHPYRNDNDLEYEEVDANLYDLLRLMLTKNPEHRIRLRDIKRHPWVLQNVPNAIGWLDDTDPGRPSSGRKIQVDERDMSDAVVPLTFLERARSAVKKAVGKVINPLVERNDSKSRRRATSSVTSSAGESMLNAPPTVYNRSERRRSLMPDDYFTGATREAQSPNTDKTTQNDNLVYDPMATVLPPAEASNETSEADAAEFAHGNGSRPFMKSLQNGGHLVNRLSQHFQVRGSPLQESQTVPTTPSSGVHGDEVDAMIDEFRMPRALEISDEDGSRAQSVDRGLFSATDKRAGAQVGVTTTVAPGSIEGQPLASSRRPRPMRSVDLGRSKHRHNFMSPLATTAYNANDAAEEPRSFSSDGAFEWEPRPNTAHHMESVPNSPRKPLRDYHSSTAESLVRAKDILERKQEAEYNHQSDQSAPPPFDEQFVEHRAGSLSRNGTTTTVKSSSTESMDGIGTPLTSPSEVTSPISAKSSANNASDHMQPFQSDPSLPALMSESSSVSADMEAELLGRPGVVSTNPSLLETTDSLTPPAYIKEPAGGFPMDQVFDNTPTMEGGSYGMHLTPNFDERRPRRSSNDCDDADDDDDHSDDGLMMMKSRKKLPSPSSSRKGPFEAKRRDTNISTTSTETAKPYPSAPDIN